MPFAAILSEPGWADGALAKKGRSYERNQYFPRPADRAVHDPADPPDAQAETTDHGISITKDVSLLRIDHVPTKSSLPGVWSGERSKKVVRQRTGKKPDLVKRDQ